MDKLLDLQKLIADKGMQNSERLQKAFQILEQQLQYQERQTLIEPQIDAAHILVEYYFDEDMIIASLFNELVEYNFISSTVIQEEFGGRVMRLIRNLILMIKLSFEAGNAKNNYDAVRKMIVALSEDIRVLFIRFADLLEELRRVADQDPQTQRKVAQLVMHVYVPLADRLGVWGFKSQLEDYAFQYLHPAEYQELTEDLKHITRDSEEYMNNYIVEIKKLLRENGYGSAKIHGRQKNAYSIYRKIALKGKSLEEIYDIFAIRILVEEVSDCYAVMGILHSRFRPFVNRIKDYIAASKPNGYKSLHTTVRGPDGRPTEIQIRTQLMHDYAEYGYAAHFLYGEDKVSHIASEHELEWIKTLQALHNETLDEMENMEIELFRDRIFVFTPTGQIKDLPKGSCPIDFAYEVHTELGDRCIGAKVNGKMTSIFTQLINGDTVEILSNPASTGPRREWLKYVITTKAKVKIRAFLRYFDKEIHEKKGRELCEIEAKKYAIKLSKNIYRDILKMFPYDTIEDLFAAVGEGAVSPTLVINKVLQKNEIQKIAPKSKILKKHQDEKNHIPNILLNNELIPDFKMALCCEPEYPERIIGYMTLTRGLKVHKIDCIELVYHEPNRLMPLRWEGEPPEEEEEITLDILTHPLINPLSTVIDILTRLGIFIQSFSNTNKNHDTHLYIHLKIERSNLPRVFDKIERIDGVEQVVIVQE